MRRQTAHEQAASDMRRRAALAMQMTSGGWGGDGRIGWIRVRPVCVKRNPRRLGCIRMNDSADSGNYRGVRRLPSSILARAAAPANGAGDQSFDNWAIARYKRAPAS